ncbi:hypothetical protein CPB84DRAFT_1842039 [Gymnopilus junonius]|uniref:Pali-domain-containing protein n=1 Tax=Gymnopilus junonius TaxID=109634 RepID=A0A9P5P0G6_GYMJU|nr:hypothetical protein CPB84DRAFT_1842039 [Gymnopilus junonius]
MESKVSWSSLVSKDEHRPLSRYRIISLVACVSLFVSFLLFLLVSLSLTIIKPIDLLVLRSTVIPTEPTTVATELRFGVWGVCASGALDPATLLNPGLCFGPQLGYTVPSYVATDVGISPSLISIVQKAILTILILHPIVAGLSTIAFLFSLFLASHVFSIFALIFTIITSLVATVTFAADLALVLVARQELANINGTIFLSVDFGNGVWMILTATILQWFAVVALSARACYCLGVRRHPNDNPIRISFRKRPTNEIDSAIQTY